MRFPVTQMGTADQKAKPSAFFISVRRRFTREILRCSSCAISRIFLSRQHQRRDPFFMQPCFPDTVFVFRERRPAKYPSEPSSP